MKKIALLLLLLPTVALGAANDFIITQYNSGGSATAPRVLTPASGAAFTTLAGFNTALGLGTASTPTFANLTLSGLTSGRVPFVTTAGLLTNAASLTFNSGTGALSATNFVGTFAGNTFTTGTGVLTIAAAKTLTASNTLTLAGTDSTVMTFPTTSATIARTDAANSFTGTQTFAGPIVATNGVHSATITGTGGASYGAIAPITLYVKSATVLTAGQPADIATIILPSGITRWRLVGTGATTSSNTAVAETAAGTLAAASVAVWTGAAGTGSQVTNAVTLPTAATAAASQALTAFTTSGSFTATTLYFNQTGNSANAGTVSLYLTIYPLP